MIILGIECSSRQGSVALLKDGDLLAEKTWIGERVRHNTIFQTLETLLREVDISYYDISLYAVGRGPGSFSGMRMSFAIAQALALPNQVAGSRGQESEDSGFKSAVDNRQSEIQINLQSPIRNPQSKVRAVSSGAALALAAAREGAKEICVVGDARRGQFWVGSFSSTANERECARIESPPAEGCPAGRGGCCIVQTEEWKLIPYEELVVPAGTILVSPEAERLTKFFPDIGSSRFPLASDVAKLALSDSEPLEPLYMHPPVFIEPKYV